jgi:hypothetical protein
MAQPSPPMICRLVPFFIFHFSFFIDPMGATDPTERSEADQCLLTHTDKRRRASRVSGAPANLTGIQDQQDVTWLGNEIRFPRNPGLNRNSQFQRLFFTFSQASV